MAREFRSYRSEGIVLRRRNLGEADSIFTVFSERDGKFDAVARGVRKARSHMRGHLEPLTFSRFQLAQGRSMDVFTQAETVKSFPGLRADLDRCAAALHCAELVDRFTVEHGENRGLFRLFLLVLQGLESEFDPAMVQRYFELHLLDDAGLQLQLHACAVCGGHLPEEETVLSFESGGLVCQGCRSAAGAGRLVSVRAIKVLRHASRTTLEAFAQLNVGSELAGELEQILAGVLRYQLERELNTTRVLRQMQSVAQRSGTSGPPAV